MVRLSSVGPDQPGQFVHLTLDPGHALAPIVRLSDIQAQAFKHGVFSGRRAGAAHVQRVGLGTLQTPVSVADTYIMIAARRAA